MDATILQQLDVLAGMAIAMLLGGLIGYERELKRRPAGFRTHMLVAGASALLVGVGRLTVEAQAASPASGIMQIDPLRLVEAVIAGVAFIGAGTIFGESRRGGETISGITTAASLLTVAVIGVAAGLDYYLVAAAATALALFVLVALSWWERRRAGPPVKAGPDERPRCEDPARLKQR
ncbi:MgtC/SapB family protein [Luteimonas saliphila]|uniref:MgtC/SapB family protein n=1 Tax=Luteimonas saliphila TaxID=2804919 RepID=UPI00192D58B7|nr:MgtC/SapB family protein [Luteimonas saliphila]